MSNEREGARASYAIHCRDSRPIADRSSYTARSIDVVRDDEEGVHVFVAALPCEAIFATLTTSACAGADAVR